MTPMGGSQKSAPERGRFRRRYAARFNIATKVVAFPGAGCRSDRAITFGTGHMAARRNCRISRCSVDDIIGRCTKRAFRSSDRRMENCASAGRTGVRCPTCRRPRRCRRIPATRYARRTTRKAFRSARVLRYRAGREHASTSAMRSACCIHGRSADDASYLMRVTLEPPPGAAWVDALFARAELASAAVVDRVRAPRGPAPNDRFGP